MAAEYWNEPEEDALLRWNDLTDFDRFNGSLDMMQRVEQGYAYALPYMKKETIPTREDTERVREGIVAVCSVAMYKFQLDAVSDMFHKIVVFVELANEYVRKWEHCFHWSDIEEIDLCIPLARRAMDAYLEIPQ
jgi:hypothetical protein